MQVVGLLALVVSFLALGLAVLTVRKEAKVRVPMDIGRLALSVATVAVLGAIDPDRLQPALLAVAALAGIGLGFAQGNGMAIRVAADNTRYARRNILGLVTWGAGILTVQIGAVARTTSLADLGLAVTAFGAATTLGLLLGRNQRIQVAARATAPAAVAAVVLLAMLASVGLLAPQAQAGYTQDDPNHPFVAGLTCPPAIGELIHIDTVDTGEDETFGTLRCRYVRFVQNEFNPDDQISDSDAGIIAMIGWVTGDREGPGRRCPSRTSETRIIDSNDNPEITVRSVTNHVHVEAEVRTGTIVTEDLARQAALAWLSELEPLGRPCLPESESVSGFTCPLRAGDEYVRSEWALQNPITDEVERNEQGSEVTARFSCRYLGAYADEQRSVTVNARWTEAAETTRPCAEPQAPRPDDDGDRRELLSQTTDARVDWFMRESTDAFDDLSARLLTEAESLAVRCGDATTDSSTPSVSRPPDSVPGDEPDGDSSEDDDQTDEEAVASALAGAGAAVVAAGIALVQNGWSAGQVIDLLQNGGPSAIAQAASTRTTTVYLDGQQAQDYLDRLGRSTDVNSPTHGAPVDVAVPEDQQWEIWVGSDEQVARGGHMGTTGRSVGTPVVVRGEDGSVVVAVDVEFPGPSGPPGIEVVDVTPPQPTAAPGAPTAPHADGSTDPAGGVDAPAPPAPGDVAPPPPPDDIAPPPPDAPPPPPPPPDDIAPPDAPPPPPPDIAPPEPEGLVPTEDLGDVDVDFHDTGASEPPSDTTTGAPTADDSTEAAGDGPDADAPFDSADLPAHMQAGVLIGDELFGSYTDATQRNVLRVVNHFIPEGEAPVADLDEALQRYGDRMGGVTLEKLTEKLEAFNRVAGIPGLRRGATLVGVFTDDKGGGIVGTIGQAFGIDSAAADKGLDAVGGMTDQEWADTQAGVSTLLQVLRGEI